MDLSSEDWQTLARLEESLWCEKTRFDQTYMNEIIADDFFEFGRSGRVYQREDTLKASPQPIDAVLPLPDLHIRLLTEDTAQVTYNSAVTYDGKVELARRSSVWTRKESRKHSEWVLRFHQGTPFETS